MDRERGWSVGVERSGGVVTVTLGGLAATMDVEPEYWRQLTTTIRRIADGDDRVIVLTGDFWESWNPESAAAAHEACRAVHELSQVTIAEVHRSASGAGLDLALACDLVVVCNQSVFSLQLEPRGLRSDDDRWLLPRFIGPAAALELASHSMRLDPRHMASMGLVNRVLPDSEIRGFVSAWAQRLASGPRAPAEVNKLLLNESPTASLEQALDHEAMSRDVIFADERAEALLAFLELDDPPPDES